MNHSGSCSILSAVLLLAASGRHAEPGILNNKKEHQAFRKQRALAPPKPNELKAFDGVLKLQLIFLCYPEPPSPACLPERSEGSEQVYFLGYGPAAPPTPKGQCR